MFDTFEYHLSVPPGANMPWGIKKNTQIYTTSDLSLLRSGPDMQKVFKICLCLKLLSSQKQNFYFCGPSGCIFQKKMLAFNGRSNNEITTR